MPWYYTVEKSSLTPPGFVFGIAWTLLYVMIALAGNALWRSRHQEKIKILWTLFIVQLLLNWSWTIIFFKIHAVGVAFAIIVLMIFLNCSIISKAWKDSRFVTYMMVPYTTWLIFAAYLNFMIWKLN
jgi:tryptophan-rich sensory protein